MGRCARACARPGPTGVRLFSRRGNEITTAYPELAALAGGSATLDGEIVAFVDGRPSFQALQERMHVRKAADARRLAEKTPVTFMAFDLLEQDGDRPHRPAAARAARAPREVRRRARDHRQPVLRRRGRDRTGRPRVRPGRGDGQAGGLALPARRPHQRLGEAALPVHRRLRGRRLGGEPRAPRRAEFARPRHDDAGRAGVRREGRQRADRPHGGRRCSGGSSAAGPARSPRCRRCRPAAAACTGSSPTVVVEVKYTSITGDGRLRQPVFLRVRTDKSVEEATG